MKTWRLWVLVGVLLVENVFLQLQLVTVRKMIRALTSAQMVTAQAVSTNAGSIQTLSTASQNCSQSIVALTKAFNVLWRKEGRP